MKQQTIVKKQLKLAEVSAQLKSEFFGIDDVIDKFIDAITAWYLFPELQTRPVVVCLWGMTGTGKTSLVKRFAELSGNNNRMLSFDMGSFEKGYNSGKELFEACEGNSGKPLMLCFDEMQHARTINESGNEMEKPAYRILWELIDSGIIDKVKFDRDFEKLNDYFMVLKELADAGFEIKNGSFSQSEALEAYLNSMDFKVCYESIPQKVERGKKHHYTAMSPELAVILYKKSGTHVFNSFSAMNDVIKRMNIKQLIELVETGLSTLNMCSTIDASKHLVVLMGNLDEAYSMTGMMNPDIDADIFYHHSLNIKITHIKSALRSRFRNEQIARMGNTHIIYPSLSAEAYRQIIRKRLTAYAHKIRNEFGMEMIFENSLAEMIYREGVYPTQGTRPVLTSIQQMVENQYGKLMVEYFNNKCSGKQLIWRARKGKIRVDVNRNGVKEAGISLPYQGDLSRIRMNRKDDMQALVAGHESGHAIVGMKLLRKVPHQIVSVSASEDAAGFVNYLNDSAVMSRDTVLKEAAALLGGIAAEKILFGEDHTTFGAENDIARATQLITIAIKRNGCSGKIGHYTERHFRTSTHLHDTGILNRTADEWMQQAYRLAESTLKQHKPLLVALSSYLSNHTHITTGQLVNMLNDYDTEILEEITAGEHSMYGYRQRLQQLNMLRQAPQLLMELAETA